MKFPKQNFPSTGTNVFRTHQRLSFILLRNPTETLSKTSLLRWLYYIGVSKTFSTDASLRLAELASHGKYVGEKVSLNSVKSFIIIFVKFWHFTENLYLISFYFRETEWEVHGKPECVYAVNVCHQHFAEHINVKCVTSFTVRIQCDLKMNNMSMMKYNETPIRDDGEMVRESALKAIIMNETILEMKKTHFCNAIQRNGFVSRTNPNEWACDIEWVRQRY